MMRCGAAALLLAGCVPNLTGAPCRTDDNCPTHQYCDAEAGKCAGGPPPPTRVVGLSVSIPAGIVALGATIEATATATLQSGAMEDVTASALWSTTDQRVAQVSNSAGSQGEVLSVGTGEVEVVALLGSRTASVHLVVTNAELVSLVVVPNRPVVAARTDVACTATGFFTDGTHADLSTLVTWSSSQPQVVAVSGAAGSGVVTPLAPGTARIGAAYQKLTASTDLTVTGATLGGLSIAPLSPTVPVGALRALEATGLFSDGTAQPVTANVQWTVDDPSLAFFPSTASGAVEGFAAGVTMVQAQAGSLMASVPLVVSDAPLATLEVVPALPDPIGVGGALAFGAWGTFADLDVLELTGQAAWSSSAPDVVAVLPASGRSEGVDAGVADVVATYGASIASSSVGVSPANPSGLLIWPPAVTAPVGFPASLAAERLLADGTVEDATDQAGWSSSCPMRVQIATGDRGGAMVTRSPASCTAAAQLGGFTGAAALTVSAPSVRRLELAPPHAALGGGGRLAFTATAVLDDDTLLDVTPLAAWTTSDPGILQVGNGVEGGRGLAADAGAAQVTATLGNAVATAATRVSTDTPVLEVWPPLLQLPAGLASALRATAVWTSGDAMDVTAWTVFSSSDPSVAGVSNADARRGELAALGAGAATVTGRYLGASGRSSVTVSGPAPTRVSVTGPVTVPAGQPGAFRATARFSDGSDHDVTAQASWTSSALALLRMRGVGADRGTAFGLGAGSADARARFAGLSGATPVSLSAATLTSLSVQGPAAPVPAGARVPLTATASFSGGSTLDVTGRAAWSSSSPAVAGVWSGPGGGVVEARQSGAANVTASFQGFQAVAPVTVSSAVLTSLAIAPLGPSGALGTSLPLRALGTFSDGTQLDLTTQARWSSADGTRVAVSNGEATRGLAMALVAGPTPVGVSVARPDGSQVTTSVVFTGTAAVPVGIEIRPPAAVLSLSSSTPLALGATALYSDGSALDVTALVSWSSGDGSVASVSAAGLLTPVSTGKTVVSAALGALTGTAPVEVGP